MIKPVHDNILVEVEFEKVEKTTASGIIINSSQPDTTKKNMGKVIAIGEGRRTSAGELIDSSVYVGARVMFNAFAGTELLDGDKTYLLLKENDVLAIFE